MAKKQDAFYFENFIAHIDCAQRAAAMLDETLRSFDPAQLKEKLDEIHVYEHEADCKKHEVMEVLAKAFITPIEREDIMQLSQNLDEVADKVEDVLIQVYCHGINTIRPDALDTTRLIVECTGKLRDLMAEFADFRHSKTLHDHVVAINSLEEAADANFIKCLRELHTTCKDPMEVFAWHELYTSLEQCMDACEHVADVVESVVMKNS